MKGKKMLGGAIVALVIAVGLSVGVVANASGSDVYSPLYEVRLNQAVEDMGLLPEGASNGGWNYGSIEGEELEVETDNNVGYGTSHSYSTCGNCTATSCPPTCNPTCKTCYGQQTCITCYTCQTCNSPTCGSVPTSCPPTHCCY